MELAAWAFQVCANRIVLQSLSAPVKPITLARPAELSGLLFAFYYLWPAPPREAKVKQTGRGLRPQGGICAQQGS